MPVRNKFIYVDGVKSIELPQYPDSSWNWYSGKPQDETKFSLARVAFAYRGITQIANLTTTVPFSIMKGKEEVDNSADWQNKLGFLPNPEELIYKIAAAYITFGKSYVLRETIKGGITKNLKYLLPDSVTPKIDPKDGLTEFTRTVGTTTMPFKPALEMLYFWLPDHNVEIGPPLWYPAKAILSPSELIYFTQMFAAGFMERGAIKATIFSVPVGVPQAEKERFESRWKRMMQGAKNAFNIMLVEADAVKPVVVGEGLEALKDAGAIARSREDIAAGLGMSLAMLLSNAANFATAMADRKNLYENVVIPLMKNIASVFNDQLYRPMGMKMVLNPEGLEVFQEDEAERASSLGQISAALADPETFLIAADILGYDLDDDVEAKILALVAVKQANRDKMAAIAAQAPKPAEGVQPPQLQQAQQEKPAQQPPEQAPPMKADLDKWQRKAIKAFEKGNSPAVEFTSEMIPVSLQDSIRAKLLQAVTVDEVKAVFVCSANEKITEGDPIMALAAELRRANDLLEKTNE
jgi:phage portal protein BeeE